MNIFYNLKKMKSFDYLILDSLLCGFEGDMGYFSSCFIVCLVIVDVEIYF